LTNRYGKNVNGAARMPPVREEEKRKEREDRSLIVVR